MNKKLQKAAVALVAACALGLAATAAAETPARKAPAVRQATKAPFAGAGLTAFIDAKTGKLRQPTPEEARQFAANNIFSSSSVDDSQRVTQWADGTISYDLTGTPYLNVWVATVNADGSVTNSCVDGLAEAHAALAGAALEEK